MIRVLGITGKMGAGKSTVLDLLMKHIPNRRISTVKFASTLYAIQDYIYDMTGVPFQGKDRKLLQFIGTDWGREKDVNLWVNCWRREVERELRFPGTLVITDDCRFDNEADAIHDLGGRIINVVAPANVRAERIELIQSTHASENGIAPIYVDATIENTGSLHQLENSVKELIELLDF
jgi:hypothetical protein